MQITFFCCESHVSQRSNSTRVSSASVVACMHEGHSSLGHEQCSSSSLLTESFRFYFLFASILCRVATAAGARNERLTKNKTLISL